MNESVCHTILVWSSPYAWDGLLHTLPHWITVAQAEQDNDLMRIDLAMSRAMRASGAADDSHQEYKHSLKAFEEGRRWLLGLKDVWDRESSGSAATRLAATRSELPRPHKRLADACPRDQTELSGETSKATAHLAEARQVVFNFMTSYVQFRPHQLTYTFVRCCW